MRKRRLELIFPCRQSIILSLIALLIGIPLAVFTTLLLAGHTLASNELDALNVITTHPLQVMTGVIPYALVIILVALITMGLSLFSTARMDVLALCRASARSTTRLFWQRFNLDLIAGVLALLGYRLSFYVTSVGNVLQGDARTLIAATARSNASLKRRLRARASLCPHAAIVSSSRFESCFTYTVRLYGYS